MKTLASVFADHRIMSLWESATLSRFGGRAEQRVGSAVNALMLGVLLTTAALGQSGGFHNDTQGCAADRPCFNGYRQSGNKVIFNFTGVTGWDFFNVRYAKAGGGEAQVENRSGSFTLNNVQSRRIYTLKVQGCNSHTLARSTCSPWVEQSVTTR